MGVNPGTLKAGGADFPNTRWSMLANFDSASSAASTAAEKALAELCRDYWPPLYAFVRRRGYCAHDAQDLTQDFFAYLIRTKTYANADRAKGKFRTFLLVVLQRYLAGAREHEQRQKRGGGQEFVFLEKDLRAVEAICAKQSALVNPSDEERLFEWHWADSLAARALKILALEYATAAKTRVFRELQPFLSGGVELPTQEATAARLCMPVETLRSHLSRLRARYREVLREEIARTIGAEDDVDEELSYLCRVLIAGC